MMKDLGAYRKGNQRKLSQEEKTELLEKYAFLVKNIAYRLAGRIPQEHFLEDLIAAGTVGLLESIEAYDPSFQVKFETFAKFRIRGAMIDDLRHKDWIPRSVRAKLKELEMLQRKLASQFSKLPTDLEMAQALQMKLGDYYNFLSSVQPGLMISLDELEVSVLTEKNVLDYLEDRALPHPEMEVQLKELKNQIITALEGLEKDEQLVMALYYYEGCTLKEIAEIMQITESRVSQIHTKALLKLNLKFEEWKTQMKMTRLQSIQKK